MAYLAWDRIMKRRVSAVSGLTVALLLCGCSTIRGDWSQKLQIDAIDSQNRPVEGLSCQIGEGPSAQTVTTPARDVRVHRSFAPLQIACAGAGQAATATVKPRRERMEEALLPFGSVGVAIDHLSGALYAYPTSLRLKIGQHLVLEHGNESQVASSEPLPGAVKDIASATPIRSTAQSESRRPARDKALAAGPAAVGSAHAKPANVAGSVYARTPAARPAAAGNGAASDAAKSARLAPAPAPGSLNAKLALAAQATMVHRAHPSPATPSAVIAASSLEPTPSAPLNW